MQRLRQAQVGKKGQLPVLPSLPSRWLGVQVRDTTPSVYAVENIYAGVHGCTLSSENTPALRYDLFKSNNQRERVETEYTG